MKRGEIAIFIPAYNEERAVGSVVLLAKKYGEHPRVVHAIMAHHEEEKPQTVLAFLVAAAFFAVSICT